MHALSSDNGLARASLPLFDTIVSVQAACQTNVLEDAFARLCRYDALFSRTNPASDVSRINSAAGAVVDVSPETAELLERALIAACETDGALDITVGAATRLWDFHGEGACADATVLAEARMHIGYEKLHVDGCSVWLDDPEAAIDLGGVAKGYIADKLACYLRERGCKSACIDLGGNVLAVGVRADGAPWRVGVADPCSPDGVPVATVELRDEALVTSATTLRCVLEGDMRRSHIFDARTGEPCKTDLLAASVIAPTAFEAEALSTPLVIWGAARAASELTARPHTEGLLMCEDGRIAQTAGGRFTLRV